MVAKIEYMCHVGLEIVNHTGEVIVLDAVVGAPLANHRSDGWVVLVTDAWKQMVLDLIVQSAI